MNYGKFREAVAAVAAKNGINPRDVSGYQVAKYLGISDGGAFYKEWGRFSEEEFGGHVAPPSDIPPEQLEALKKAVDKSSAEVAAAAIEVIRAGRAEIDATALVLTWPPFLHPPGPRDRPLDGTDR